MTLLYQLATYVALVIFVLMAGFQLLLALGVPWGHLAWGGFHKRLPTRLRIGSLVAVGIYVLGIVAVLDITGRANLLESSSFPKGVLWFLVVLFGFSILGNIMSNSRLEKRFMTPVAILLFASCLILVTGGNLVG